MSNIKGINNICENYTKATKIKCDYIEIDRSSLLDCKCICDLCNKLDNMGAKHEKCMDVFRYSYYQAERFGGKYIFFCSTGLVHWCSIVNKEDNTKGLVVAGPVTIIKAQEFIEDEIFPMLSEVEPKIAVELYKMALNIPNIEPDVITSLSELLHSSLQYGLTIEQTQDDLDKNFVDNVKNLKSSGETLVTYSIAKEKELLSLIKQSNENKAREILNEILASIFVTQGMNLKVLRSRVLELTVLLSRAVLEVGVEMEEVFGINCYLLDDINKINDLDELLKWSNDILNKFMDLVFGLKDIKNKDIIFKAISYINKNYMNHITLEEVSEHIALSPSYFSSIFKKEVKVGFSDYINKIRIENSKKLLGDNSIKLVEVAYLAGFESQSYFTKVFKKSEGITPKQYRKESIHIEV